MTFNVADGHSPTAILSGIFSYSLAAVDNISTDLACARGPSSAAELLVLEREQTERQTDRQVQQNALSIHARPGLYSQHAQFSIKTCQVHSYHRMYLFQSKTVY